MMCRGRWHKVADASRFINIADLRRAAERRLPRSVFDYIDGGADGEVTLRENTRAFDDVTFRPRCAVEVPASDLRTTVLGTPLAVPFIFAPVGSSRMFWPRGEAVAASVAGDAGTIYCLSTLSGTRLEEVKAATKGPAWFQLYLCGGRDIATRGTFFSDISQMKPEGWQPGTVDAIATGSADGRRLVIKAVNYRDGANTLLVHLQGRVPAAAQATLYTITAALHETASLEQPDRIKPVARPIEYRPDLTVDLEPYTVAVLEIVAR